MQSWWIHLVTVMAQWPPATTNFLQPARAAAPPMPMTPVPSLAPATAQPLCQDLWTILRPKVPGTGHTQTRPQPRASTRVRKTHSLQLHPYQVSLQPLPERVCAVFVELPPFMTWRALGPIPRLYSGTDMPVKVGMIINKYYTS